jgi:biotin transport system substrate-specific component
MSYAIPSLTRVSPAERGLTIADFLVPVRVGERVSPRSRDLGLVLAGVALLILGSRISVPLPGNPVPFTLQTLAVLIVGGSLGLRRGVISVGLFVALGIVGLPVFAESRSGLQVILGSTGGYLIGFIVAGALVGRLAELGWDRHIGGSVGMNLLGSATIYLVGVPWLAVAAGMSAADAIRFGLVPFVVGDVVKLLVAAGAFPAAWWVVGRRPSDR